MRAYLDCIWRTFGYLDLSPKCTCVCVCVLCRLHVCVLYVGRDASDLCNYHTIIVSPIMTKLFGCILEMKQVYVQSSTIDTLVLVAGTTSFQQAHSTIGHLVTLSVHMEECRLVGKDLHCFFVYFKKTFDMVP